MLHVMTPLAQREFRDAAMHAAPPLCSGCQTRNGSIVKAIGCRRPYIATCAFCISEVRWRRSRKSEQRHPCNNCVATGKLLKTAYYLHRCAWPQSWRHPVVMTPDGGGCQQVIAWAADSDRGAALTRRILRTCAVVRLYQLERCPVLHRHPSFGKWACRG